MADKDECMSIYRVVIDRFWRQRKYNTEFEMDMQTGV